MSNTLSTGNYTIGGGELYFSASVAHPDLENVGTATIVTAQSENIASANTATKVYSGTLSNIPVLQNDVVINASIEKFTDDGAGVLTGNGSPAGSGTITYNTGAWSITLGTDLTATVNVTASYNSGVPVFQISAYNLGNVTNIEISPDVTYVDHYVSTSGKRVIDKTAATTSAINISFTFDEMNEDNLAKFFLGDLTASEISVLQNEVIEGSAHLVVDTDIGQDMTYIIPKCALRPDGALTLNEEDWHNAPTNMQVLAYSSADGTNATWLTHTFGKIDTANL